jgi:hypothetical protein
LRRALEPSLLALLAIGATVALHPKPASAIELGELHIESSLGQAFNATVPFVLNEHEELYNYCITLARGTTPGLKSLTRARISIVGSRIVFTGSKPINEPMLAMRMSINCPYTVRLTREYMVMTNPAGTAVAASPGNLNLPAASTPELQAAPIVAARSVPPLAGKPVPAVKRPVSSDDTSPIYMGDSYRVQNGDTLSKIVNRIEGQPIGLQPAMNALLENNPEAFVASDINRLMAGSLLLIPALNDYEGIAEAPAPVDSFATVASDDFAPVEEFESQAAETSYQAAETSYAAESADSFAAYDSDNEQWAEAEEEYVADDAFAYSPEPPIEETVFEDDTDILTSGNAEVESAEEIATTDADEFVAIDPGDVFTSLDEALEEPVAETESPVTTDSTAADTAESTARTVPVAIALDKDSGSSWSKLIWGAGGLLAIILGGFAFGPKLRGLFGGDKSERVEPDLVDDDEITQQSMVLSDVDFPLDESAPIDHPMVLDADLGDGVGLDAEEKPEIAFAQTTELDAANASDSGLDAPLELDADLGAGTGLQEGTDLDLAQDFGFSATGENAAPMDLELPVEIEVPAESLPTDIIPPHLAEKETILDSEVAPVESGDETEYDLSMIVDATKQALGEGDATARDLNAVQLDAGQEASDDSAYTLSKEVDFKVLEQDYEEELTQTQAVNEEIVRAAAELAANMETDEEVLDLTVDMPVADDAPADNDADATELNEELTLNEDVTVEMDAKGGKDRAG